jgi:hypothetical protein
VWNDWVDQFLDTPEVLAFYTRSEFSGIVMLLNGDAYKPLTFAVSKKSTTRDGSQRPAVCDLCYTQRANGDVRLVTFYDALVTQSRQHGIGWLVCTDFQCSGHVRNMTNAAMLSRASLRETEFDENAKQVPLTQQSMVERLRRNIAKLLSHIEA